MSLDTAKAAVTLVHNNLLRKRELDNTPDLKGVINFFGGEPLLEYDSIIVPLTIWIEEIYSNDFNLGITTNGTLLTKKRIDFLYDHNIVPLLSIDGDKETQDYNRPCKSGDSSFDQIISNIPYLLEKFPDTVFRMTIYEDTCDKLFENILFAEKQGFKYFFASMDSRNTFSEEGFKELQKQWEQYSLYFVGNLKLHRIPIKTNKFDKALIQTLGLIADENLGLDPFSIMGKEIFRCGLGTCSVGIGPNGNIYSCQEHSSTDKNSIFYIGNLTSGIDEKRHITLIDNYRNLGGILCEDKEECKNCSLRRVCNEIDCPSASFIHSNNFTTELLNNCKLNKILYNISKDILSIQDKDILTYVDFLLTAKEVQNNGLYKQCY